MINKDKTARIWKELIKTKYQNQHAWKMRETFSQSKAKLDSKQAVVFNLVEVLNTFT